MNMFRHNFNFKMNLTLKPSHNVRFSKPSPHPHPQPHPHHIKIVNNVHGDVVVNNHDNRNYTRAYHLDNPYGLGDSVFNMTLFNLIKEFIIANDVLICYYVKKEYIYQLTQFINYELTNHVKLFSLDKKPQQSIELWIENPYFGYTFSNNVKKEKVHYNDFYLHFYRHVLQKLTINANIQSSLYSDNDLLVRANAIPPEYKSVDILILNSVPCSGQYNYNKNTWDKYIQNLNSNSKLKIVTTTKVEGVLCTFEQKLTIKDIAALSTQAKVVIAINSGVFPGLLNVHTMESIKQFYIFDKHCCYSFPRFQNKDCITEISIAELNYYATMSPCNDATM